MPNPECDYCKGKGWYWVQDGPDDVDREPCFCLDFEYETEEGSLDGKNTCGISK